MTNAERRALEIFTALIIQHIRKNNHNALKDIRAFFYGPSFKKTYDPDLIYRVCETNIEKLEQIPSHQEVLLCLMLKSNTLKFTKSILRPFYKKSLSTMDQRRALFSGLNIQLYPKIRNTELFHENLLTFYKELCIIGKNTPIKNKKE